QRLPDLRVHHAILRLRVLPVRLLDLSQHPRPHTPPAPPDHRTLPDVHHPSVLLRRLGLHFFFSSRRRHTRSKRDWTSDVCSSDLAVCNADMILKGQPINAIAYGDTLTADAYPNRTFHYCLSNPPFGVDWKKIRTKVTDEHEDLGWAGRFGAGLPRVSDGWLLFLMHLIAKMHEPGPDRRAGRAGIVLNGSPLFTGGAGSGESNIRKWVLEQDWLEAIIALPTDMFYNTGIATYVWILNKDKDAARRRKVQLIDGTALFEKMRKSVGSKRNHITEAQRDELV